MTMPTQPRRILSSALVAFALGLFPAVVHAECAHHLSSRSYSAQSWLNSSDVGTPLGVDALLASYDAGADLQTDASMPDEPTPCGPGMNCSGGKQENAPTPRVTVQHEDPLGAAFAADFLSSLSYSLTFQTVKYSHDLIS